MLVFSINSRYFLDVGVQHQYSCLVAFFWPPRPSAWRVCSFFKGCHFLASVPSVAFSDSLSSRLHQAVDLAAAGHLLFAGLAVAADRAKPQAWPLVSLLRESVAGLPAIVGSLRDVVVAGESNFCLRRS